ncbi:outer membrane lipid asymmetry maintenance protein MlaD [Thioflexithrix psekupsensis]|uniref:Outer membrane lipid asymmetry maintenance protein MlaD n=1 Tax=Thioflexithrix psekupsensis TaxID=1570016 RepID=A0A251X416_9GAMM|nr:outer membrane lipid asymmetry maintenance protein MlaD [Thioflexithrix psekupsensis]
MQTKWIEIWVGVFVVLGFAALLMLAMRVSNLGEAWNRDQGYQVTARFENIGGLKVKSPVRMSGVRVGRVTDIRYDDTLYQAVVTMTIEPQYRRIPLDTSAAIYTSGLLGEQYIGLDPGADIHYLSDAPNSELMIAQSAIILEQLISRFLYSMAAGENK